MLQSYRARIQGDAGTSTLEYVGVMSVAALLVVALLLVAAGTGLDVADRFKQAICQTFSLPCGPSDSQLANNRLPKEPCTIGTNLMAGEGQVDVVFVTLGGGASLMKTRKSDGTYEVTLINTGKAQASTGVGAGFFVDTGKGRVGAGAEASVAGGLAFGNGMTWTGLTLDQANSMISDLKPAVETAPAGVFGSILRDAWEFLDGPDDLRQPDQTFVQGGLQGDASAEAAFGGMGAGATANVNEILGYREDHTTGSYTVYISAAASLNGEAGLFGGADAQVAGGATGLIELTVDKNGVMQTLTYTGQASGKVFAELAAAAGSGGDPALAQLGTQYNAVGNTGTMTEINLSLDLRNERNAAAVKGFLGAAGLTALPGGSPVGEVTNTVNAGKELVQRFYETGTMSIVDYDVDSSRAGAGASGKLGIELGASGGLSWEGAVARRAQYWNGKTLVDLPGCTG